MDEFLAAAVLVLVLLALREWQRERERREWVSERCALMERCVPGLVLSAPIDPGPERAYGTDEDEWAVEQERRKAAGWHEPA